jgi:ribosomal protein L33
VAVLEKSTRILRNLTVKSRQRTIIILKALALTTGYWRLTTIGQEQTKVVVIKHETSSIKNKKKLEPTFPKVTHTDAKKPHRPCQAELVLAGNERNYSTIINERQDESRLLQKRSSSVTSTKNNTQINKRFVVGGRRTKEGRVTENVK